MTSRDQMVIRSLIAALFIGVLLCLMTTGASAHARLEASDPVSGSALELLPGSFHLDFSEPVDPLSARAILLDPLGKSVQTDALALSDDHRSGTLIPVAGNQAVPGTYTMVWSVISESDGHDSTGSVVFSVGTGRAPPIVGPADNERAPWWQVIARTVWLLVLGIMAAFALTPILIGRRRRFLACLALGGIGLCAALIGSGSLADLVIADVLQISAGVATMASALAIWLIPLRRHARWLAILLWSIALVLIASSGHAAGIDRSVIAISVASLHLVLALGWFGLLFGWTVRACQTNSIPDYRTVAGLAACGLLVLTASGVISAWLIVPDQRSLVGSAYGITLAIKVLIVILVMTIAATNRWIVPRWLDEIPKPQDRQSRWLMATECWLLLITILLATVLSSTSPPSRFGTVTMAAPVQLENQQTSISGIDVELATAFTGTVDDRIVITLNPVPATIQRVIIDTTTTREDGLSVQERFDAEPDPANSSRFTFSATRLGLTALWTVDLNIRSSDSDDIIASFAVDTREWIIPAPVTQERSWSIPQVPLAGWVLLILAFGVLIGGLAVLRRQSHVAPLSGAIIILALGMIATGFVIQAIQRSPPRTVGHQLKPPETVDLVAAQTDYALLCVACHGPAGAGLDSSDPNHQHGSGTNLIDDRSHTPADGDLFTLITEGVVDTDMPAFHRALTDQQRWNLVAYLRTLQDAVSDETPTDGAWIGVSRGRQ